MRGELRSKACSKGRVVIVVTCCVRLIHRPAAVIGVAISAFLLAGSVTAQDQPSAAWQYGGFFDVGYLNSLNDPSNHLFRNRGTTPRVDEWDLNIAGALLKRSTSDRSVALIATFDS